MIGAAYALDALAHYWPLLLGGWLASIALAAVAVARAGRVLNRTPRLWRCASCQALLLGPNLLADHIVDHHAELMPRVDA